jgi:pimeloyl-ACP methyl ester carboxylesterase
MARMLALAAAAVALLCVAMGCGGSGSARPRLVATPASGLWGAPLRIELSDLAPHAHATLRARTRDARGTTFTSNTPVTADVSGRVVLRGDAALRVLWTLTPPTAPEAWAFVPPQGAATIHLAAAGVTAVVRRGLRARGVSVDRFTLPRDGVDGELFEPRSTSRRRPAVLLLGGSEGALERTDEAELLASHGYPALALAYFHASTLPKNLLRIPLEYFARALRLLARQPGVDPSRLVVDGESRGSEAAQLIGIHYPALVHGVIAEVPNASSACGIEPWTGAGRSSGCLGAAWTYRGKAIPYDRPSAHPDHPFADERIDGPILLTCGEDDLLWPSCPMAHAIATRLHALGFAHRVTMLDFPHGGHGVGGLPNVPSRFPPVLGASRYANEPPKVSVSKARLAFLRALD